MTDKKIVISAAQQKILNAAQQQYDESESASGFNRRDAHEDIRFSRLADQWPENIKRQRQEEGRPCLTVNKLPAFIRQVVNDARQNKPGIQVHAVDNGADPDTAQVIGGLVRSIERSSNADVAYDTAIDHSVTGGFGFFRIGIEYAHEESFDLEARIYRVPNPLSVHWDVNSTAFDASDWMYAFVGEDLTPAEFKTKYPGADPISFQTDERDESATATDDQDTIRIVEYWSREEKKRSILRLSNNQVVRKDDVPEMVRDFFASGDIEVPEGTSDDELTALYMMASDLEVMDEREATYYEVKRRVLSGAAVLEEEDWPGSTIPICPVWGDEVIVDGRRHFRSMIRDAKDPQTMFNFWRTAATELVALAPKAPFLIEENGMPMDADERKKWESANTRSHAYLAYRQGTNQPKRQAFAGVPAGALQEALSASDDMKAIIGIYDSALGARSNETSGRAIMARQREADVSNFHFIDNLSRAIRYAGKVLVEIIPSVYSARDTIRILGEDDAQKVVQLGAVTPGEMATGAIQGDTTLGGEPKLYDLAMGKYDVTVSSGPSYQTQREESREFLIEIMRQVPGAAQVLGDLAVDVMDFPNADKIAERLRMLLPPQLQQGGQDMGGLPGQQVPGGIPPPGALPQGQPQGGPNGF